MRLLYVGHFGTVSGYAYAAYDYLAALSRLGVHIRITPAIDGKPENVPERFKKLLDDVVTSVPNTWATHVFVHAVPYDAERQLQRVGTLSSETKKVCYTTWETFDFPKNAATALNKLHFDKVFVPSKFNEKVMNLAGVHNLSIIPHCYDPKWWTNSYLHQKPILESPYSFYTIFSWHERKNPLGLLKAYLTEFTDQDDVVLRIVTPTYDKNELVALVQSIGRTNLPKVEFLGLTPNRLTDEDVRRIHQESHCYVTLARGEGFGLGAFEAMLVGNFVITPHNTGFDEFTNFRDHYGYCVRTHKTPAITPESTGRIIEVEGLKFQTKAHHNVLGITGDQHWLEPDIEDCRNIMRSAFKYREGQFTKKPSRPILENFSYEVIGKKLLEQLESP